MTTSYTDTKHPYYEEINKRHSSRDAINFFTGEDSFRMRFVSLGEALDFVSSGGLNYVAYEMDTKKLMSFIQTWMKNQEPREYYKRVPSEISGIKGAYTLELEKREWGYRWNDFRHEERVSLPRIKYPYCPRDNEHEGTIRDLGGRIRCSQEDSESFDFNDVTSYSTFDMLAEVEKVFFVPQSSKTVREAKGESIGKSRDICYAIIEETPAVTFPLETILDRLNCSHDNFTVHPFSGFTLANYIKAWWEQPGKKRVFRKKGEKNYYKEFGDFLPVSSED